MVGKKQINRPPYSETRYSRNAGIKHGVGIPAQTGKKDGTFTEDQNRKMKNPTEAIPRKFN